MVERTALAGFRTVTHENHELVRVMDGGFDLEVGAAADQRAAADEQLGENRDRVGFGVRRDLLNDRAGQTVEGVGARWLGPARRCGERDACGLAGSGVRRRRVLA